MKRQTKTERIGAFEVSYVARAEDMYGKMEPYFWPHWHVQYLGDGIAATFRTKRECLAWIKEWKEICA